MTEKPFVVTVSKVNSMAQFRCVAINEEAAIEQAKQKFKSNGLAAFQFSVELRKKTMPDMVTYAAAPDTLGDERAQKKAAKTAEKAGK